MTAPTKAGIWKCSACEEPTDAGPCPGCGTVVCQNCAEREGEFCCDGEPESIPESVDISALRASLASAIAERDEARAERNAEQATNICDACVGDPTSVLGGCMCRGTGRMSQAALYLRERLFVVGAERDAALSECERLKGELGLANAVVNELQQDVKTLLDVEDSAQCPSCWAWLEEGAPHDEHCLTRKYEGIVPRCRICGKPAACIGRYEGHGIVAFACDECCGHGNEDGECSQLAAPDAALDTHRAALAGNGEMK